MPADHLFRHIYSITLPPGGEKHITLGGFEGCHPRREEESSWGNLTPFGGHARGLIILPLFKSFQRGLDFLSASGKGFGAPHGWRKKSSIG